MNPNSPIRNGNHHSFDLNSDATTDVDHEHLNGFNNALGKSKPNLHDVIRKQIFDDLLSRSKDLKLPHGATNEVAELFSVHVRTVRRIWKQGKDCLLRNEAVNVCSRKSKNCGRKRLALDSDILMNIPLAKRTTMRDVAAAANVGLHAVHKLLKSGDIRRHSNCIKPLLTDRNKKMRLEWCLSMLDPRSVHQDPIFKGLFDIVFIDEKWFNMTKRTENYYLSRVEDDPLRTCKSTNFIGKVMFSAAMTRPRMDENGNCIFDGKIGCFPLVTHVVAQRSSANRAAGTLEIKPITSITKDVMRSFMLDKIVPAVRATWPREDMHNTIFIQQDNAPTHIDPSDKYFQEVAKQDGFDIRLICQPPNSPDLNILDLGFFRAIQAIQYKQCPKTVAELVNVVEKAFEEYSPVLSNRIFLTLQSCMVEIMKARGSNDYKIPHLKKEQLEKEGRLPLNLKCDLELVNEVSRAINT
ncbi:uncharacterized protein LOC130990491 [Salvia miltiorrhiza]|uniref:uncharacterized protein LOC130990491 n=1 Tax=Salvia miltiorrhiza TaxID=226208 RepID=UPI0025ACE4F8|nr:uncharacterized protein LOC130990491 [Salvia miltiorrhiza]